MATQRTNSALGFRWLSGIIRQPIAAAVLTLLAFGLSMHYAWRRWGEPALVAKDLRLQGERLLVTPQPAWIHSDIKGEVLRTASLEELHLRDPRVTETVGRAFAVHTWVARVKRVTKRYPGVVQVDLDYRRPCAVVEVAPEGERGLYFIDADSVLLPSEDFAPGQARSYLRIAAGKTAPAGPYGTQWGDERVAGAAQIAELWQDKWQALGLFRIAAEGFPPNVAYKLQTKAGREIWWGRAPHEEQSDEAHAAAKMERLLFYAKDHGEFDNAGAPALDVRPRTGLSELALQPHAPAPAALRSEPAEATDE
jgi:hypothetical protein